MKPLAVLALLVMLTGCTQYPISPPQPESRPSTNGPGPVTPIGDPEAIAENLAAPWSVVRLESGSALISERDSAIVKELTADGEVREVGTVPGVGPGGEGGLLGLAVLDGDWLYAYLTAASDNRIIRMELRGEADGYGLGDAEEVLTGLEKAGNHNGGRIAFGPDGMLYATVGDAGEPPRAQDPASNNGKILRMTPTGDVPDDNPFDDSLVYSLGHRNPQGIAWDDSGQLFAAEFGQETWDEFNIIEPGGNYGWPEVEGIAENPDFIDPLQQWATSEASPSGLAFTRGTFFLAALRGERVWAIYTEDGAAHSQPWFPGEFGRIRDVIPGPDGSLWFLTNNTDGRGEPVDGDDRLWQVELDVFREG